MAEIDKIQLNPGGPLYDIRDKRLTHPNVTPNIDEEYDACIFHTNANSTGTYPIAGSTNYAGAGIAMPFRKAFGNEKPDYASQIWIPAGNKKQDVMFFRSSHADAWDPWVRAITSNELKVRYLTFSKSTTLDQTEEVGSTVLPAGHSYLIFAIGAVNANVNDRTYYDIYGADFVRAVRASGQYGGGAMLYSFLSTKSSDTTISFRYHRYSPTAHNATFHVTILQLPYDMQTF